jgi:Zn-finger nucleic acid-binding protein
MTIGHIPPSGLDCPRCAGRLETWARATLRVEFCNKCSALFLDRGELFQLFRSEGYRCPPEPHLQIGFSPHEGEVLGCPKCEKPTLVPGTVEGVEVWHCTPCNGFLVDRSLLLGEAKAKNVPLHLQGFKLVRRRTSRDGADAAGSYISRVLGRLAWWARSAQ